MKKEDILIRGHSCNYVKVSYFLQLADWKPNQRSIHHTGYPDTVSKEGYTTHGAFIVTYILFSFDVMIHPSRNRSAQWNLYQNIKEKQDICRNERSMSEYMKCIPPWILNRDTWCDTCDLLIILKWRIPGSPSV